MFDTEPMRRTDNIPVQVSNTKFLASQSRAMFEVHNDSI